MQFIHGLAHKSLYEKTSVKRALWLVNYSLLFAHRWMVTKARARSEPYAPLSARLFFYYSGFAKIFLLIPKKKFTKTLKENAKFRRRICYSAKKRIFAKNNLYTPQRENITAITSIPLLSVSKRCGFHIPGFGFRIPLSLKLGFSYSLWLELEFKIQHPVLKRERTAVRAGWGWQCCSIQFNSIQFNSILYSHYVRYLHKWCSRKIK